MAYKSDSFMFRDLDDQEELEFRQWGQENDPRQGLLWTLVHPVVVEEWEKRGLSEPDHLAPSKSKPTRV